MERGKQTFDLTTLKGVAFEYEVIRRQREPAAEQDARGDLAAESSRGSSAKPAANVAPILRGSDPSLMG